LSEMREEQIKFQESLKNAVRSLPFPMHVVVSPKVSLFEQEEIREKIEEEIID
jgi:hypothetical protein